MSAACTSALRDRLGLTRPTRARGVPQPRDDTGHAGNGSPTVGYRKVLHHSRRCSTPISTSASRTSRLVKVNSAPGRAGPGMAARRPDATVPGLQDRARAVQAARRNRGGRLGRYRGEGSQVAALGPLGVVPEPSRAARRRYPSHPCRTSRACSIERRKSTGCSPSSTPVGRAVAAAVLGRRPQLALQRWCGDNASGCESPAEVATDEAASSVQRAGAEGATGPGRCRRPRRRSTPDPAPGTAPPSPCSPDPPAAAPPPPLDPRSRDRGRGSTGRTTRSPTTAAGRSHPRRRRAAGRAPTGPRAPGPRRGPPGRARPATPATRADPRHTSAGCAPNAGSPTTPRPAAGPDRPARRGRGARPRRARRARRPSPRPRLPAGLAMAGEAAGSARSVMGRDGSGGHRQPGDIAGYR